METAGETAAKPELTRHLKLWTEDFQAAGAPSDTRHIRNFKTRLYSASP